MASSFDLAERGFCRVRWLPGREPETPKPLLGLRELLLWAPDIVDVEVPHPPALAGLMRVLEVLTARVTGLDALADRVEWEEAREAALDKREFDATAVNEYFAKHQGRFELLYTASETPFFQDVRLLEQCTTSKGAPTSSGVNKLVLDRAAGQAFVWHSHTVDAHPPRVALPDAAFAVLTWLYYGPPGRCTPRRVGEVAASETKAGPLRATVSFHPVGQSLFETLLLGVPYALSTEDSPALWEDDPWRDPCGLPPAGEGVGTLLANRFRHALLLEPSEDGQAVMDARITWGLRLPPSPALDPYLIYRTGADGTPTPETAQADRATWRDLDCLVGRHEDRRRPAVFEGLDDLMDAGDRAVRIKALGFEQDRSQAKDQQYFAGTTPVKQELWQQINPHRFNRMRTSREAAETSGRHLQGALTSAWRDLTHTRPSSKTARSRDGGVPWLHTGMRRYWQRAENLFWQTVSNQQPPEDHIVNRFIHAALDAYDDATRTACRDPRDMEIVERNRRRLWAGYQTSPATENGTSHD